jgi:hypothetical protein
MTRYRVAVVTDFKLVHPEVASVFSRLASDTYAHFLLSTLFSDTLFSDTLSLSWQEG